MSRKRTRSECRTALSQYLGAGKEMHPSELPTLRDCLRHILLLKETGTRYHFSFRTVTEEICNEIRRRWTKANCKLQPPVTITDCRMESKLLMLWAKANKIARGQIKSEGQINSFEEKLDRLFEITKCRCQILSCGEADCCGCPSTSSDLPPCHIKCFCPRKQKIPITELSFLLAQRQKVGERSSCMMGGVDQKESKKLLLTAQRKERLKRRATEEKKKLECGTAAAEDDAEEMEENLETCGKRDPDFSESTGPTPHNNSRNMTDIRHVAMAVVRYGVSSNAAAAIANGALLDFNIISKHDTTFVIDAKKVHRAKMLMYADLQREASLRSREQNITCILFDGRKDLTLMYRQVSVAPLTVSLTQ